MRMQQTHRQRIRHTQRTHGKRAAQRTLQQCSLRQRPRSQPSPRPHCQLQPWTLSRQPPNRHPPHSRRINRLGPLPPRPLSRSSTVTIPHMRPAAQSARSEAASLATMDRRHSSPPRPAPRRTSPTPTTIHAAHSPPAASPPTERTSPPPSHMVMSTKSLGSSPSQAPTRPAVRESSLI